MTRADLAIHRVPADAPARVVARAPRVVVVGDFVLDGWWSGKIDRLTREAPVPIVDITDKEYAPGGAANTAANLASLGAEVSAVGMVGDDPAGSLIREKLDRLGVNTQRLMANPEVLTTTKCRIVGGQQLLLRLDETRPDRLPADSTGQLCTAVQEAVRGADAMVVCDYASGAMTDELIDMIAALESRPPLCVVDAHDPQRWRAIAPDIVTPNAGEVAQILGRVGAEDGDRIQFVVDNADALLDRTGARAVVATLDRDGTVLLCHDMAVHRTHAHPTYENQASGAGDTFTAALTVARAAGFELEDAVDFAQVAADVAVQKPGTCLCTATELESALAFSSSDSVCDAHDLVERLDEARADGKRIVFTNGCFDVLHRGHTSYLRQAKQLGDLLIVAINDDDSVRRLKGPQRPINPANDRANVLAALSCVDYVTVFDDDTPSELIRLLRPHVYAKGGDYTPQMLAETPVVREVGGEIAILDYVPEHSTTGLVNRIRSRQEAQG
jgi:rfaE bifunctional protein kinase chain/domain/rfaE bifunctional protein nucleotidyltransferase chain/domain